MTAPQDPRVGTMPVQREWEVRLRARVQQSVGVVRTYDAPDPVVGFMQQVLKEAGRDQEVAADIKIVKVGVWEVWTLHANRSAGYVCRSEVYAESEIARWLGAILSVI